MPRYIFETKSHDAWDVVVYEHTNALLSDIVQTHPPSSILYTTSIHPLTMSSPYAPPPLTPREAVTEVLYRCLHAIDSNDKDGFNSSFVQTEELTFEELSSEAAPMLHLVGWSSFSAFMQQLFDIITTHTTSNVLVEFQDADTAILKCTSVAYHVRPENVAATQETSFTGYSLYTLTIVKDGGAWKIKRWEIKLSRSTGDLASVLTL